MICRKCKKEAPDGKFCALCGAEQNISRKPKTRGSGTGSVYRRGDKWLAVRTMFYLDEEGQKRRKTISRTFEKKSDAINALPMMYFPDPAQEKRERKEQATLKVIYELWLPTHRAGKDTMNCYKAAWVHLKPLHDQRIAEIDVDDLQECIDECPNGKATRRNMKTLIGLLYKYAIPRGYLPEKLVLSDYLVISGEEGVGGRALPDEYVKTLRKKLWQVPGVDIILVQCYTGFRPSELLSLRVEDYNAKEQAFIGGAKTDAGRNRTVTISPKIAGIVKSQVGDRTSGPIYRVGEKPMSAAAYREIFYAALAACGLENPTYEVKGKQRHTYTPHSCRHTFATMMKKVTADSRDKLELIGHTSEEMLRYYQEVSLEDLRKITDRL